LDVLVTKAVNCAVPEDVTVAAAGVTVTVMAPASETVIRSDCAPCEPAESVAWTAKLKTPVFAGVPEMVPVVWLSARPEGKDPDARLKTYGAFPPLTLTVPL
jgi:hypothetical protein